MTDGLITIEKLRELRETMRAALHVWETTPQKPKKRALEVKWQMEEAAENYALACQIYVLPLLAQPAGSGGVPDAWLHTVVQDDGEQDFALSFSSDSFPLQGVGGFKSIGVRPLYAAAPASPQGSVEVWGILDRIGRFCEVSSESKARTEAERLNGLSSVSDNCKPYRAALMREVLLPLPSSGDGRGVGA